ncbi:hypothetical protein UFOVP1383_50 [uncultured Caudovirales phage]|uniref:Uncharacterized protein n=1 Tax=uncultured Caudovirales phage TaxID=2100421 RepID=A0A6J5P743_9CAUD|nr:hypothetical protein UFOVP848_50 [uncultured Caudovirales phage]CAB4173074.1 hypothetical protein UFOVP945_15 [uncultured Caudovirales phage]CAB4179637.1 hypothetical protein UFOVP1023_27 [uncultured Caudovirales phage]CAB4204301.1 hypothetical protein UFOVP1383_50 [uncultured Caudovirales phage]CAB4216086.1 hypothetical protein UFOVP1477_57 [uncultured Caudovirales phage]
MNLRELLFELRQAKAGADAASARGDCPICDHGDHLEACLVPACRCTYANTTEAAQRKLRAAGSDLRDVLIAEVRAHWKRLLVGFVAIEGALQAAAYFGLFG